MSLGSREYIEHETPVDKHMPLSPPARGAFVRLFGSVGKLELDRAVREALLGRKPFVLLSSGGEVVSPQEVYDPYLNPFRFQQEKPPWVNGRGDYLAQSSLHGSPNFWRPLLEAGKKRDPYGFRLISDEFAGTKNQPDLLADSLARSNLPFYGLEIAALHIAGLLGKARLARIFTLIGQERLGGTTAQVTKQFPDQAASFGEYMKRLIRLFPADPSDSSEYETAFKILVGSHRFRGSPTENNPMGVICPAIEFTKRVLESMGGVYASQEYQKKLKSQIAA